MGRRGEKSQWSRVPDPSLIMGPRTRAANRRVASAVGAGQASGSGSSSRRGKRRARRPDPPGPASNSNPQQVDEDSQQDGGDAQQDGGDRQQGGRDLQHDGDDSQQDGGEIQQDGGDLQQRGGAGKLQQDDAGIQQGGDFHENGRGGGAPERAKRPSARDSRGGESGSGSGSHLLAKPPKRPRISTPELESHQDTMSRAWGSLEALKAKLDLILSDGAKKELRDLGHNPNQFDIIHFVDSWEPFYKPNLTSDYGFTAALERVANGRNSNKLVRAEREPDVHLLSDDIRNRLEYQGIKLDLASQVRLARTCLHALKRQIRTDSPYFADDAWNSLPEAQDVIQVAGAVGQQMVDAKTPAQEEFLGLSGAISNVSSFCFVDYRQMAWESLDAGLRAKFMQWSHCAEEVWNRHRGFRHCFIEAWIWHLIDDHFISSTVINRDPDMFTTPVWAADDFVYQTIKATAITEDQDMDVRLQLWRATGAACLSKHHLDTRIGADYSLCEARLNADYIVRFLKRELHPMLDLTEDGAESCLEGVAKSLVLLDQLWRVSLYEHVVLWNPENHLSRAAAGGKPSGRLSGFAFEPSPKYADPPVMRDQMLDSEEGEEELDRRPRPDLLPVVELVYQPMLVMRGVWMGFGHLGRAHRRVAMQVVSDVDGWRAAVKEAMAEGGEAAVGEKETAAESEE